MPKKQKQTHARTMKHNDKFAEEIETQEMQSKQNGLLAIVLCCTALSQLLRDSELLSSSEQLEMAEALLSEWWGMAMNRTTNSFVALKTSTPTFFPSVSILRINATYELIPTPDGVVIEVNQYGDIETQGLLI